MHKPSNSGTRVRPIPQLFLISVERRKTLVLKWPSSTPSMSAKPTAKGSSSSKLSLLGLACLSYHLSARGHLTVLLEQMRQSPATILQPFSLDPFPVYKEPCMVVLGRHDQCQPARQSCLSSGTSLDGRRWWLNKEECDCDYCDVLRLVSSPSDLDCSQFVFYFLPLTVWLDLSDWRYVLTDWEAGRCDTEQS